MRTEVPNYAFIDSQNLYLSIRNQGWKIDFSKLRIYLREKYLVSKAFIFIGYVEGNQRIYKRLQEEGYVVIFKQSLVYKDGSIKGNCDAELVLNAMIEYDRYEKAVIVSGDGDFYCLVDYLKENNKLRAVLIPDRRRYSSLLNKVNTAEDKYISFVGDSRSKLEYIPVKKKAP